MNRSSQLTRAGFKPRDKPLAGGGPLKRSGRLKPRSDKMKAQHQAQKEAYAAAEDADAEWCSCCGKPGEVEHSHILSQKLFSQHRNNPLNWLQMGKWCDCHRLYENNKALFAKRFPKAWAETIRRLRLVDLKEYDRLASKIPELYPD